MFYIYHIPGIKIGVSENPERRVKVQGFTNYEILEQYTCIYKVSKREQELQKEYGYLVDTIPYWKTINAAQLAGSKEARVKMSNAKKGRKLTEETKNKMSLASKGIPKSKEHIKKTADTKRGMSYNISRFECPYCDKLICGKGRFKKHLQKHNIVV